MPRFSIRLLGENVLAGCFRSSTVSSGLVGRSMQGAGQPLYLGARIRLARRILGVLFPDTLVRSLRFSDDVSDKEYLC